MFTKEDAEIAKLEAMLKYPRKTKSVPMVLSAWTIFGLGRFYQGDTKMGIIYALSIPLMIATAIIHWSLPLLIAMGMFIATIYEVTSAYKRVSEEQRETDLNQLKYIQSKYNEAKEEGFEEYTSSEETDIELSLMRLNMDKKTKSSTIAGVVAFFFGWAGGLRYYVGQGSAGVLILFLYVSLTVCSEIFKQIAEESSSGNALSMALLSLSMSIIALVISFREIFKAEKLTFDKNEILIKDKINALHSIKNQRIAEKNNK